MCKLFSFTGWEYSPSFARTPQRQILTEATTLKASANNQRGAGPACEQRALAPAPSLNTRSAVGGTRPKHRLPMQFPTADRGLKSRVQPAHEEAATIGPPRSEGGGRNSAGRIAICECPWVPLSHCVGQYCTAWLEEDVCVIPSLRRDSAASEAPWVIELSRVQLATKLREIGKIQNRK